MDNSSRIACCNICLLSSMRTCESCPFNPGRMKLSVEERAKVTRTELLTQSQAKENQS